MCVAGVADEELVLPLGLAISDKTSTYLAE